VDLRPTSLIRSIRSPRVRSVLRAVRTILLSLRFVVVLPASVLLPLGARLLSPFVRIRFGSLRSDRIGHFAGDPELDLCRLALSADRRPTLVLASFRDPLRAGRPVNSFLAELWRRHLRIIPAWLMDPAIWIERRVSRSGNRYELFRRGDRDTEGLLTRVPRACFLSVAEIERGWEVMASMGVPRGAPFVIVNARDSAYLSRLYPFSDWSYHDYRNVDVETYNPAARLLVEHGYRVIRVGRAVERPWTAHSGDGWIVDYSSSEFVSDFMDVFLCSECAFMMSNQSGIDSLASFTFRRPVLLVGVAPVGLLHTFLSRSIAVIKHYVDVASGERLSLAGIADRGLMTGVSSELYSEAGVRLEGNSPAEILDATSEMLEFLASDNAKVSPLNEQFRDQFRSALGDSYDRLHGEIYLRMGERFLATSGLLD